MMDTQKREFVPVTPEAAREKLPYPVLSIGEVIVLKTVEYRIEKMKTGGKLRVAPNTKYRIGFATGELVAIKGVVFRVTFDAGKMVGLRMTGATI